MEIAAKLAWTGIHIILTAVTALHGDQVFVVKVRNMFLYFQYSLALFHEHRFVGRMFGVLSVLTNILHVLSWTVIFALECFFNLCTFVLLVSLCLKKDFRLNGQETKHQFVYRIINEFIRYKYNKWPRILNVSYCNQYIVITTATASSPSLSDLSSFMRSKALLLTIFLIYFEEIKMLKRSKLIKRSARVYSLYSLFFS